MCIALLIPYYIYSHLLATCKTAALNSNTFRIELTTFPYGRMYLVNRHCRSRPDLEPTYSEGQYMYMYV